LGFRSVCSFQNNRDGREFDVLVRAETRWALGVSADSIGSCNPG